MCRILLLYTLCIFNGNIATNSVKNDNDLEPKQLITIFGYPFENHIVQTSDGYLLTLHRIPNGIKNQKIQTIRPPVLIMHGMVSSSADFLVLGPKKSIPFLLADAGYDVWLGNNRGNTFSRKHISIDPDGDNVKFYDFSLHEIATLDLPAKIDYILKITKQKSLFYIGHSQGTTIAFILLSTLPKYNKKIKMVSALAPVAFLKGALSPTVKILDVVYDKITQLIYNFDKYEIFSYNSVFAQLFKTICATPFMKEKCTAGMFLMTGFDLTRLNRDLLSIILENYPAGSSIKQILHFGQIRKKDRFAQYDFGPQHNLLKYKQIDPPEYDLSQITTPVILHYAFNDYFASVEDVLRLATELPRATMKLVPCKNFSHVDYLFAKDVVELLYNEVLDEIKSFT